LFLIEQLEIKIKSENSSLPGLGTHTYDSSFFNEHRNLELIKDLNIAFK